jgi:hypothetical protein
MTLIVRPRSLEWLDPFAAQGCGRRQKHLLINQSGCCRRKTIGRPSKCSASADSSGDARRAKKIPLGFGTFRAPFHPVISPGKVEHRTADDNAKVFPHDIDSTSSTKVVQGRLARAQSPTSDA